MLKVLAKRAAKQSNELSHYMVQARDEASGADAPDHAANDDYEAAGDTASGKARSPAFLMQQQGVCKGAPGSNNVQLTPLPVLRTSQLALTFHQDFSDRSILKSNSQSELIKDTLPFAADSGLNDAREKMPCGAPNA